VEEVVPEPLRAAFSPGDSPQIPGFVLQGVIGRGASGIVYRAREIALDREVALKVLHTDVAKNTQTVRRLQREARTTARLGHPHIVSAIAIGEHRGLHWYAMGLVDGPSLAQVLRQDGRLREREALRYFIPLCEALEHLWEHGVVHRDIKPANILIDHTAGAQLADLGLAFADADPSLTSQGATLGTPHYISPEQAVDPTRADVRSDIWSFGATLYHAVCGRPPFHGESTALVLSSVLHARVPDPLRFEPALSRGLTLILRKCLTRDPAERYQTPRELLLDLERVRERRAPKVVKSALDPVEREPRPWVRTLVGGGAVVLALCVVIFAATRLGAPVGDADGGGDVVVPQRFAALEALVLRARDGVEPDGQLLRELEDLRPRVPAGLVGDWEVLRNNLRSSVRGAMTLACDDAATRVDQLVKAGDFVAARTVLDVELPAALARATGMTTPELEERFGYLRSRREDLSSRVGGAQEQHAHLLERKLPERVTQLLAEADRLRAKNRFKSALSLLAVSDEDLLEAVGFGGWHFESARVSEVLGQARVGILVKRQELEFAWRALDTELRASIDRRVARIREELATTDEPTTSAADDLDAGFENELFQREIEREEMPLTVARLALDHVAEARLDLIAYEDELRSTRFRGTFDLNRDLDRSRWQRRDYDAVLTLWTEFAESLAQASGEPSRPWRVKLAQRANARIEEARLLRELLRRAGAGVIARDGQRRDMRVLQGGIVVEGRIRAGLDPLRDGFTLVPDRGEPFALRLETMFDRDLLELADVAPIDEDLTPVERVMVAAFRYHEGDLRRADVTLGSGEVPSSGVTSDLARDLRTRIKDEMLTAREVREERDKKVSEYLSWVSEEAMQAAPYRAQMAIDKLLGEYAGETTGMLRASLLEKQHRLEQRPRSFETEYGPDELEEKPDGSVRMKFSFDRPEVGGWKALDWRYDGAGWSAPDVVRDWDALKRDGGAQLILRPPLDVAREVEVRIRFMVVDAAPPAQLLLVSLLGFHAAITGPGLPTSDRERRSRWSLKDGGTGDLLDELRRGKGEETKGRLLRPGEEQEVVLRVNARRGFASLSLDGALLGERNFRTRTPDPASLVLRSWDPIRVTSVELVGSR
jgi:tRNA A-37 threonylcarbamoyl transferase component Bud32